MDRVKGIFFEHKNLIMDHLKEKIKPLTKILYKQELIQYWESTTIQQESDHDALRTIFDLVEHRNNEKKFVRILRDISDEIANLVERPPQTTFVRPLHEITYVKIGDTAVLECELGKKYSVKWLKNNKQELQDDKTTSITSLNGTHTLTISNIKRDQLSIYSCVCGAAKTLCELKIEEPLAFIKPLEDKFSLTGETVVLQCKLKTPYNGEPEWTKDDKGIPKRSGHFKTENLAFTKKLTLFNFERKDAGVYKCVCGTASTQATIRISSETNAQRQVSLTYSELEKRNRECEEELENEKVVVQLVELDKKDLERQVEELKKKSDLNEDLIRQAEEKMIIMNKEIDSKYLHIESLKSRVAAYSKELKKKEKVIQTLSDDFSKMMVAHEKKIIEKETQDRKFNKFMEKFNTTSTFQRELDTEKKKHEIVLKELSESEQIAVKEKRNAEDCARIADIEKKKAENDREVANMKIKQLEKDKQDLQFQKDEIIEQQKLAKTGMKQNILLNQQQEKDKQKTDIELKKLTEEIKKLMEEKHKSETNIDQNPLSLNETENATKQIKQLVEDKKEIEIQKQQVEADLLTERQKREALEAEFAKSKHSQQAGRQEQSGICTVS